MVWGVDLHEHSANSISLGAIEVITDERFVDDDAKLATVVAHRVADLARAQGDVARELVALYREP
jgi:hypothetical protein